MSSLAFSYLFIGFLILSMAVRLWLSLRQIRHVKRHRNAVPPEFSESIPLVSHQRAADYTVEKNRFGMLMHTVNAIVVIGFTLLGGLQWLSDRLQDMTGGGIVYQLGLLVAFALVSGLVDLPFECYRQFVLEQKFGFNRMTPKLFFTDMIKSTLLGAVIGLPLAWVVLSLMHVAGEQWWLYAWIVWCAFQGLMLMLFPTFIAPLFNKFTPLEEGPLRSRIEGLMQRVGFASSGLFVMDGSRRSAHGNAYFSGFGRTKRIVFFDTLIERLAPNETEAVLAHELGHFKLRHIVKRIAMSFGLSLLGLALLGYLKQHIWFYTGLGVDPLMLMQPADANALALILFAIALPIFLFLFSPLASIGSRKHEFEADAFAASNANRDDLVRALVKLYEDNASTLTPDPIHSAFYDSHPPATIRIQRLLAHA